MEEGGLLAKLSTHLESKLKFRTTLVRRSPSYVFIQTLPKVCSEAGKASLRDVAVHWFGVGLPHSEVTQLPLCPCLGPGRTEDDSLCISVFVSWGLLESRLFRGGLPQGADQKAAPGPDMDPRLPGQVLFTLRGI